jgi:hypothetical protein
MLLAQADWTLWQYGNYHDAFFFENARLFKYIFRKFEAFLNISILFEDIFREIEVFF